MKNLALVVTTVVMASALGLLPASSRQWKATPEALTRDYASIVDSRPGGESVTLMWIVPRMVPSAPGPGAAMANAMLQKYVMMVVAHGHLDMTTGTMSFDDIDALDVKDKNGKALTPVARSDLPPTNIATLTAMEAIFRQSLGAMGKGMKMFVFDGANIDSCKKGQLSVPFADQTYTWDTPFPGCDKI